MKWEFLSPPLPVQKSTASPIWKGDGVVSRLSEKDFPSEAEFLRAEARRIDLEGKATFKAHPELLAHLR